MTKMSLRIAAALLAACLGAGTAAADPKEALTADQFDGLSRAVRPQPGESKWAALPWQTNLKAAREKAVAEDKPLLLWRSGGGDALGRC